MNTNPNLTGILLHGNRFTFINTQQIQLVGNYMSKTLSSDTMVVYHLLGKTGWSTVVVNGTRQIPNGNFHGDTLVRFPRLFPGR